MIIEQKSITKAIVLMVVVCLAFCSCASGAVLPVEDTQESPTIATTQQTEVSTVSTTHPIEAESTNRYATIPYDLWPYVREAIEYDIRLDDFAAMFGSDSIRYTRYTAYSVATLRNGQNLFVFFDCNGRIYSNKIMENFKSESEFLDFILGNRVTFEEMEQFTPNYTWDDFSSGWYASFYVQEGVFCLEFEYDINSPGEGELYLAEVRFLSDQEIEYRCANGIYDAVQYILVEDRLGK